MASACSTASWRTISRAPDLQVDFYQLGRDPLGLVLTRIAGRVLAGGGRLIVVTGEEGQAAALDEALWAGADQFLPHGREGADQPVLIADRCEPADNGARHVAIVDGRWRDEALGFDRAFHFFDEESIEAARAAWRSLRGLEGVEPRYWRQDEGGWTQVA